MTKVAKKPVRPDDGRRGGQTVGRDSRAGRYLDQKPVTKRANISDADAVRAVERYFAGR